VRAAFDGAVAAIADALRMPIRHAGPGQWTVFDRPARCDTLPPGAVAVPGTRPAERAMVVGDGAHLVIDSVLRPSSYRRASEPGACGREPTFTGQDEGAPHSWEPEFTLGQLYNRNIFLIGSVGEVSASAEAVPRGEPPARAGGDDLLEIMRWTKALRQPSGTLTRIDAPRVAAAAAGRAPQRQHHRAASGSSRAM
jgi:hypothetical protein